MSYPRMTILVVDDDRTIRLLMETILSRLGVKNILLCTSKEDALGILSRDVKIDGAILDLVLVDGTGLDVAKACHLKDIPVVFCTSTNDLHNSSLMYSYGWVLSKPVLLHAIERACDYFSKLFR